MYTLYTRDVSKGTDVFLRKNAVAFETSFYFLLMCYELIQYQESPSCTLYNGYVK